MTNCEKKGEDKNTNIWRISRTKTTFKVLYLKLRLFKVHLLVKKYKLAETRFEKNKKKKIC